VIVKLAYARESVALDLREMRVRAIAPSAPPGRADTGAEVARALDLPLDGPPLADLARGRRNATVIVPDATRKACLADVLPAVLRRLRGGGIDGGDVTVLVANGTHPAVGPEGLGELLGPLPPGIRAIEHDSRDENALVAIGELRPGLPLRLHRAAVECDLLVTVGGVRHHYFAGFGGGPKMLFPGVGGYQEIQANHALVLERSLAGLQRHPGCEPGCLEGNPVAEEIQGAAGLRAPDLALCLVEGRDGGIAWAGAGPWRIAFSAAVERARSWFEFGSGEAFELMVAGAGGAPSDSTLIQAHKSLDASCRFLAPGGELLWVAALDHGLGSLEMAPFVDDPRPESIMARLETRWVQYGHTTLRLVEKTARYRVRLHSALDPVTAERLGFEAIVDPAAVVEDWRRRHPGGRVGVMASAAVYPRNPR
jgi:nickel-dependent lactate racemase